LASDGNGLFTRTPFIFGGDVSDESVFVQFIAILKADDYSLDEITAKAMDADLDEWEREIGDFITLTFLDAPGGGETDEAPIASACAWLEWRFASAPFGWDYDTKTALTPLRRLYQLARCQEREAGQAVVNPLSGRCEGDWLDKVNEELQRDPDGTKKIIAEIQARDAARRAGIEYVTPAELNAQEVTA